MTQTKTKSRARLRTIPAGYVKPCAHCGRRIKASYKSRLKQVICNVYEGNEWHHVEHWHLSCYEADGEPYGEAE